MASYLSSRKIIFFTLGLFLLFGTFFFIFEYYLASPAKKGGHDQVFLVREGSTLNDVVNGLMARSIITSKRPFLLWARIMGYSKKIKAGEYRLNSGMTPLKVLDILSKGIILTHRVTIPEGFTRRQIAQLLEEKGLANKREFLVLTGDPVVARRYDISGPDLEGYLYPDTYQFARGLTTMAIIDTMVNRFREVMRPFLEKVRHSGMGIEEVVTLASIVEKETGRAEERGIIASVFLNRLKKGMRIESDPTVIYGIRDFNGNLTRDDLTRLTHYNTYLIWGLPPGPIANPGKKAIEAVLYPAKTDYLYFVSRNDGSHYFSKTLSEHNRAVRIYQKKRGIRHRRSS